MYKLTFTPVALALSLIVSLQSAAVHAAAGSKKSIRQWSRCDGKSADNDALVRALAAASHHAFTLVIDCPMHLKIGQEYEKSVYIDDGTAVEFSGDGKITVDNVMVPAFVIANSSGIDLINWNIEYDAGLPIDGDVHGFMMHGQFKTAPGRVQPAGAFNNFGITPYLASNRRVTFDKSDGGVTGIWKGGLIPMAVFLLTGDTTKVAITGMRLYAPKNAGVDKFIPVAFSLSPNFKSNQSVSRKTPITAQYVGVPHGLTFSNIELDGTYMGWLGNTRDTTFENIRSHRYGDLEDAGGTQNGGVKKWFAPPHLFYLNYDFDGDPELANTHIKIMDVVDDGPRVGTARDKGGGDTLSGYALSLKIGCNDCSVTNYKSYRPDGFLDVLPSNGLTFSNVEVTYDSAFLNGVFPGWRFPSPSYKNLTFENITITDTADTAMQAPIGNVGSAANESLVFKNVTVRLKQWSGKHAPIPNIGGQGIEAHIDYAYDPGVRVAFAQKEGVAVILQTSPAGIEWSSRNATGCMAGGGWSGALPPGGNKSPPAQGDLTLQCDGVGASATASLRSR